jgi:hypothetical protein
MGLCVVPIKPAGAVAFPCREWEKYPLSIRDSTESGVLGQREGEVYMWIREAGTPVIGKSSFVDQIL